MTEYQARFLVTSLHMLAQWSQQKSPITGIQAPGVLVAHDQNGAVIVPAPIDYLSWTPRIAAFWYHSYIARAPPPRSLDSYQNDATCAQAARG